MKHSRWAEKVAQQTMGHAHGYESVPFFERAIAEGTSCVEQNYSGVLKNESDGSVLHDLLLRIGHKVICDDTGSTTYLSATTTVRVREHGTIRHIRVLSSSKDVLDFVEEAIDEWLAELPEPPPKPPTVYSFGVNDGQYMVKEVGPVKGDLHRANYTARIVKQFDAVVEQLKAETPSGRLVLMEGEPGTGKTHLVRALIASLSGDCKCILVPPNVMADLAGPAFLDALMDNRGGRIVLILEDADDCLIARDQNAAAKASLSSLLNMSDGILGSALDLCIVATTNQKFDNLDRAVLRPGRLLQRMSVGALSPAEADACFRSLTGRSRSYDTPRTLAQVYEDSAAPVTNGHAVNPPAPAGVSSGEAT